MMKFNKQWFKDKNPCIEAVRLILKQDTEDAAELLRLALKDDHFDWVSWGITRSLTKKDNVRFAIYCAKLVLPIHKSKNPEDNRPREAIEAASAWLKNPTDTNRKLAGANAAYAYANAAYDAAYDAADAAYDAADAASDAATAATAAATAATAAATAATAASDAAAYAAGDARSDLEKKIMEYGIKLLREAK